MSESSEPDDEFSVNLLEQIFDLWVEPELARRDVDLDRSGVAKALVIMAPGKSIRTLINDEAELVANVKATRPIAAGEEVTTADFDEITGVRPFAVDPDAGWICFARLGTQVVIAFDFRRNRARATRLVERAQEFCTAARLAHDAGLPGPAIEAAYAAAELGVVAQMLLIHDDPPRSHPKRKRWFVGWTELGNAPVSHSKTLTRLAKQRHAARYAERALTTGSDELSGLLNDVVDLIDHAEAQCRPRHVGSDEGATPAAQQPSDLG